MLFAQQTESQLSNRCHKLYIQVRLALCSLTLILVLGGLQEQVSLAKLGAAAGN